MIVVCPSCGTSYHHRVAPGSGELQGKCSRCSGTFSLSTRASYRVEPAPQNGDPTPLSTNPGETPPVRVVAPPPGREERPPAAGERSGAARSLGLDDPGRRSSLGKAALDQTSTRPRPAMTHRAITESERRTAALERKMARTAPKAAESVFVPHESGAGTPHLTAPAVLGAVALGSAGFGISAWTGWPAREAALSGAGIGMLLAWGIFRWKVRDS